jgi:hypothetical protein
MMKLLLSTIMLISGITVCVGQDIVTVGAETANIRNAPSARAAVIKVAKQGESFPVIAQQGAWNKVKIGNAFGWIHGNSLATVLPMIPTVDRWGDPNSKLLVLSDGTGTGTGTGTGSSGTVPSTPVERVKANSDSDSALRITYKPAAQYSETARKNQVQGTVRLRVTFLSTGEIGDVVPITELPDGLTEQAVNSARAIRFEPMRVNGEARSTTKIIEYSFSIY